jgi:hypothetical protein
MSLRERFDEAIGGSPPPTVEFDQVIRRATQRARIVRIVGAATVTLLIVATGAAVALRVAGEPTTIATTPPTVAPRYFPMYALGNRIIAEVSAPLADGQVELTFTPSVRQQDLVVFVRCDAMASSTTYKMTVELSPGEMTLNTQTCGELDFFRPGPGWAQFAEIGQPTTIRMTITPSGGGPHLADGTFGLAVGEPVGFLDYPLPPRPAELPPLDPTLSAIEGWVSVARIQADPSDPGRPVSATVRWSEHFIVAARAQTPGQLHLEVNGVRMSAPSGPLTVWDYDQRETGLNLDAAMWPGDPSPELGQEVTVTVVPEHITGAWVVELLTQV